MSDRDSLVATRARRANAGSRLKQLIEIEELASDARSFALTEDDENVELLFQEDENDEEFNDEEEEDGEEEEEEQASDDNATGADDGVELTSKVTPTPDQDESTSDTEIVNDDEMLSDSDLSVSDDDESEGERELEKQERANKRRKKPTSFVPAIKKPKPEAAPKPVSRPLVKHSELLLMSERRSSSRKSALRNKEQLIDKIKKDEKRRAALTPIVRVKERKLTQEERLAQAVETERDNIESLHLFMEQEIVKKERQKWLLQLKRQKLRNVIRFVSEETFVCPLDEVEDDRHVQDLYERPRNRRRRRFNELSGERRPGDIDTELPYYKKEMEERRIREIREAEERRVLEEARAIKRKRLEEEREARKKALEEERLARKTAKEERLREFENVDISDTHSVNTSFLNMESTHPEDSLESKINENGVSTPSIKLELEGGIEGGVATKDESAENEDAQAEQNDSKEPEESVEAEDMLDSNEMDVDEEQTPIVEDAASQEPTIQEPISPELTPQPNNTATIDEVTEPARSEEPVEEPLQERDSEKDEKVEIVEHGTDEISKQSAAENTPATEGTPATEDTPASANENEKKVSFELTQEPKEVPQEEEFPEQQPEVDLNEYFYRPSEDGTIFEGPVQHVGRNHVMLLDFDDDSKWGLTDFKIKSILFGEDGAHTGPRRLRDTVTILKSSTRLDNPYAAPKEEKDDEMFKPVTEIKEDDIMFEVLRRIPRLGDKNVIVQDLDEDTSETTTTIRILTEAPTGLYLPNGNKKLCLISGKEVRYFDPVTGIPYENKEVYKIIKDVEMGLYSWHSIGKDVNTYGSAQVYLNRREGARHAKGVPEGFDG